MRAEQLVGLCSPHGVDLLAAARLAAKPMKGVGTITKSRHGVKSTVLIPPPENRVRGKNSQTMVKPMWSLAELGQCAQGVPEVPFAVAMFVHAGDRSRFWYLQNALFDRARILAAEQRWPVEVSDFHGIKRPYLAHLAKLVLDHDANPSLFKAANELHWIYLGVGEKVWANEVRERFLTLKNIWDDWLSTANRMIQRKLRPE